MARRTVTLSQIARRTGVHVSTVSRALNERTRHLVNADVAARIIATARDMDYRPNLMAAALRTHRTRNVGVVVDAIADPARAPQIAGIEAALREAGYAMTLVATAGDPGRLAAALDMLDGRGCDGAILLDRAPPAPAYEDDAPRLPLITPADLASAGSAASALAVDHLVRRGHRHIGFLAVPTATADAPARLAGFRDAMTHAGLFVTAIESCGGVSVAAGEVGATALLARRPNLTALAAADDRLALGALAALAAQGRACPQDLSIVGIGDLPLTDATTPPLTTVALDGEATGRHAVALLLARIDGGVAPPSASEVALIERGSTGPARAR